jgi:GH15 family glucan-1,4-alpha-glucosidase
LGAPHRGATRAALRPLPRRDDPLLAALGEGLHRAAEARGVLDHALRALSPLGLLSEDYDVRGELWGNYPQAYSHVGLIHAAFEASPRWGNVD